MQSLIATLNALKHFPSEDSSVCPISTAPTYVLFFNYAGAKVLTQGSDGDRLPLQRASTR